MTSALARLVVEVHFRLKEVAVGGTTNYLRCLMQILVDITLRLETLPDRL